MFGPNHDTITTEALKPAGLKTRTRNFIVVANNDSDSRRSRGMTHIPQHFQNSGDNIASINAGLDFFKEAMGLAILLVVRGGSEDLTKGLYCFGRALHCIQDFYAHSNWVVLDPPKQVWGYGTDPKLKVCYVTRPGFGLTNLDPFHSPMKNATEKYDIKVEADRLACLEEMRTKVGWHPDCNFDGNISWASRLYKAQYGGPQSGYQRAKELAIKHSRDIVWPWFANAIGLTGVKALENHKPDWNTDWTTLRREFNDAMKIPIG
jgi:hypothetical protein